MSPKKIVALLPMKAHSERIPGKNFKKFDGKPLFRWVLDSLLSVRSIGLVVINTDARRILAKHGLRSSARVLIRDRRSGICGDYVSMNKVIEDDVRNVPADVYLMTHTTNPLLSPVTIRAALSRYEAAVRTGRADSLFTVNRFQSRFYRADASAVNHDPKKLLRTQDLEPWFEENSNLYIFSKKSFDKTGARIGVRPALFETPRYESADIDDRQGWVLAESISRAARTRRGGSHGA